MSDLIDFLSLQNNIDFLSLQSNIECLSMCHYVRWNQYHYFNEVDSALLVDVTVRNNGITLKKLAIKNFGDSVTRAVKFAMKNKLLPNLKVMTFV